MREKIISIWSIAVVMVLFLVVAPLIPSNANSKAFLSKPPAAYAMTVPAEESNWWAKLNPFG